MTHDEIQDLLGAYALDAVDDDVRALVEEHIADCARCRAEVQEHREVATLLAHIGHRDQSLFPVVDDAGMYVGVLTTADLGAVARAGHALDDVLIAADVAHASATLAPNDSLLAAVRQMGVRGDASLPVVDPSTGALRGVVSRSQILGLYERAVARSDRPA